MPHNVARIYARANRNAVYIIRTRRARPRGFATKHALVRAGLLVCACCAVASDAPREVPEHVAQRSQSFDREPGWDGYRNRLLPKSPPKTRQSFGYRASG